jgi:hypothetical protein
MKYKVRVCNLGEEPITVFYQLDPEEIGDVIRLLLMDGWDTIQVEDSGMKDMESLIHSIRGK